MKTYTLALFFLVLSVAVVLGEQSRVVSVSGKSTSVLDPHFADISISIEMNAKSVSKCSADLSLIVDSLRKKLISTGLKNEDIVLSSVRQGEKFEWISSSRKKMGYYARTNLNITINEITSLPQYYELLGAFSAITVEYTTYNRTDLFEKRNEEFQKALLLAKKKAEIMALTLNAKVGKVKTITEIQPENYFQRPMYSNSFTVARGDSDSQRKEGSVTVSAQVSVDFFLE